MKARQMKRVTTRNLHAFVTGAVDRSATLHTDEYAGYRRVGKRYASDQTVNHSRCECARGEVHTNTIEGFFSILKRGIYGTFHSVSDKHLNKYLWEFKHRI